MKKNKIWKRKSRTTSRSAFGSNGVSSGYCVHCRSYAVNDVSFILRENDLSFELLSSAMNACRSLVSWAEFRRTTCRSRATVLSPVVADDLSSGGEIFLKQKQPHPFFFVVTPSSSHISLSLLLSLLRPATSSVSLSSPPTSNVAGGKMTFLSPLL